jgi:hypothetical protein
MTNWYLSRLSSRVSLFDLRGISRWRNTVGVFWWPLFGMWEWLKVKKINQKIMRTSAYSKDDKKYLWRRIPLAADTQVLVWHSLTTSFNTTPCKDHSCAVSGRDACTLSLSPSQSISFSLSLYLYFSSLTLPPIHLMHAICRTVSMYYPKEQRTNVQKGPNWHEVKWRDEWKLDANPRCTINS